MARLASCATRSVREDTCFLGEGFWEQALVPANGEALKNGGGLIGQQGPQTPLRALLLPLRGCRRQGGGPARPKNGI
jgi:hypothetical protein